MIERFRAGALTCVLALTLAPGMAAAEESLGNEAGIGAASALSSLVYGPVKLLYATTGVIFGGMAYGLSGGNSAVFDGVITPAVRGDYVVTPSHLRGEQSLEFYGQDPAYRISSTPAPAMDDDLLIEDDY